MTRVLVIVFQSVASLATLIPTSSTAVFVALKEERFSSPYRRLVFSLSISDAIKSVALLLGPFATLGDQVLCDIQGFFGVLGGIGGMLYLVWMCLFFLLTVKNNMSDEDFARRYERYIHTFTIFIGGLLPSLAVAFRSMNPTPDGNTCMVIQKPIECNLSEDIACGGAEVSFDIGTIGISVLVVTIFLSLMVILSKLYATVRGQERKRDAAFRRSFVLPTSSLGCNSISNQNVNSRNSAPMRNSISVSMTKDSHCSRISAQTAPVESTFPISNVGGSAPAPAVSSVTGHGHGRVPHRSPHKRLSFTIPQRVSKTSSSVSENKDFHSHSHGPAESQSQNNIERRSRGRLSFSSVRSQSHSQYSQSLQGASSVVLRSSNHDGEMSMDRRSRGRLSFSSLRSQSHQSGFANNKSSQSMRYKTKGAKAAKRRTRETLQQAILYLALYVATYVCPVISLYYFRAGKNTPYVLAIFTNTLYPLSGLLTMLVYTRTKVATLRRRHKGYSWTRAFLAVVKGGGDIPAHLKSKKSKRGSQRRTQRRSSVNQQPQRKGALWELSSSRIKRKGSTTGLRHSVVDEVAANGFDNDNDNDNDISADDLAAINRLAKNLESAEAGEIEEDDIETPPYRHNRKKRRSPQDKRQQPQRKGPILF